MTHYYHSLLRHSRVPLQPGHSHCGVKEQDPTFPSAAPRRPVSQGGRWLTDDMNVLLLRRRLPAATNGPSRDILSRYCCYDNYKYWYRFWIPFSHLHLIFDTGLGFLTHTTEVCSILNMSHTIIANILKKTTILHTLNDRRKLVLSPSLELNWSKTFLFKFPIRYVCSVER